jgi:undecaprenyl-diphosphatase
MYSVCWAPRLGFIWVIAERRIFSSVFVIQEVCVPVAEWIKVVILGIVEGITEFLPVSSTGHLLVVSAFLEFEGSLGGTFEIFIQVGAVVAVIGFYHRDLLAQMRTVRTDPNVQRLWLGVVIASIPAAVLGLLLRGRIKEVIFPPDTAPVVVAIALILGGIVFLIVERRRQRSVPEEAETDEVTTITLKQAVIVGIVQTLALIPGTSRSGASIVGGMLAGMNRKVATTFSFYLAIPVLGGATIVDLLLSLDEVGAGDLFYLLLGAVISGIVAWISIGWLLRYVSSNTFIPFGYYRILAGSVILLLFALGNL